jgi:uncharacterized membrane protein YfhO
MSNAKRKKLKQRPRPQTATIVPPRQKTAAVKKNPLLDLIAGKEVYLAVALITIVAFFVYKDFLLLDKAMLYKDIGSDTLNGLYPIFRHTSDYLFSIGLPSWSFNHGMGQNIFPFFFHGPIDIFLYLFGKNGVVYGIGYIEFFKVIAGGMIFFFYLKTLKLTGFVCVVGGLIYSFSAFMILGGTWYLFSSDAVSFALLLLAFERLFRHNSWWLLPIAIALIGMSQPFNLYLFGVFLLIYATFRFLDEKETFDVRQYFALFFKMGLLSALGLLLSSALFFENVLQLIESPRGSGGASYFKILSSAPIFAAADRVQSVTSIMRLFSSDLLGTGSEFKGWNNYLEAPMFYSGLLTLLLVPQAFAFLNKRRKILYGSFLLFWFLLTVFPYFRHTFWLFTGDYYRGFSFLVSFSLIYVSLRALNGVITSSKINLLILIGTLVLYFIMLSYPYFHDTEINPINDVVMGVVKAFLVLYTLCLVALRFNNVRIYVPGVLLLLLCAELGYLSHVTVNDRPLVTREELSNKVAYNDYSVDAVNFIKKQDHSFYRVDKNYGSSPAIHASLNDGMVQDYYGTSAYSSFNQLNYIHFLETVDVSRKGIEEDTRWARGTGGRPVLEGLVSAKYFLSKNAGYQVQQLQFDSLAKFGDVTVLRNNFYLPFGFAYDRYINADDFDTLSATQKDFTLLRCFVAGDDEKERLREFSKFDLKDTLSLSQYSWDIYRNYVNDLKKDTLTITDRGETFLRGTINLAKKKLLFLSIPFDKGWKAQVNDKEQKIELVDGGLSGLILDKGINKVELKFKPRLLKIGVIVSLLSLILYFSIIILISRRSRSARPSAQAAM